MHILKTWAFALAAFGVVVAPASAQIRTVDPNSAIDSDLTPQRNPPSSTTNRVPADDGTSAQQQDTPVDPGLEMTPEERVSTSPAGTQAPVSQSAPPGTEPVSGSTSPETATAAAASPTYEREDLISAAEGVFGKGAEGLATMIERVLKEQGKPNAYIAGREASGAFVVGLRYGSGVMTHRVEGARKVYWTGPSLGFDVGGDANKVFVLAYNLYDSQELFKRYPAVEGRLFFVGGFAATYLRRGNVVLIPIRLGVGWRAGLNVGYMRFSEKAKWVPF